MHAVHDGDTRVVSFLLREGAHVNLPTPEGTMPLAMAAVHDQLAVVQVLLAAGADPTLAPPGHLSALAVSSSSPAIRSLLVKVSPSPSIYFSPPTLPHIFVSDPSSCQAAENGPTAAGAPAAYAITRAPRIGYHGSRSSSRNSRNSGGGGPGSGSGSGNSGGESDGEEGSLGTRQEHKSNPLPGAPTPLPPSALPLPLQLTLPLTHGRGPERTERTHTPSHTRSHSSHSHSRRGGTGTGNGNGNGNGNGRLSADAEGHDGTSRNHGRNHSQNHSQSHSQSQSQRRHRGLSSVEYVAPLTAAVLGMSAQVRPCPAYLALI
jgi:hypothetical protein